jgi:Tfp pilus assembly protein PilO
MGAAPAAGRLRSDWLLWTLAGVIALNLLGYALLLSPRQQSISELIAQYSALRRAPAAGTNRPRGEIDALRTEVARFVEGLPRVGEMAMHAGELEALLRGQGLTAGPLAFTPEKSETLGLQRFVATVAVSGPYTALRAFLAQLQQSPTLWCIEQLIMRDTSGKGEPVELQFTVATYVRPSAPAAAMPASEGR